MTIARKFGLGLLVLIVLLLVAALAAVLWTSRNPARPIGAQQLLATDAGHASIPVTVFYPTSDQPRWKWLGTGAIKLAPNGAIDGQKLPLVIISHGTGATSVSHLDTALALAAAGYVVAAPLHPGDNLQDQSSVGTHSWMTDRARHLKRTADFMLAGWPDSSRIDAAKVGLFGYSAGGTAALIDLGGRLDPAAVRSHCATKPEFVCKLLKPADTAAPATAGEMRDRRVKAAVLVAPGLGFGFPQDGLSQVQVPVQLWAGSADANVPAASNAVVLGRTLPRPSLQLVPGASHFSFLPPCGLLRPLLPATLCTEPGGFDRSAFQQRFNRSVVGFFDAQLARPAVVAAQGERR